MYTQVKTHWGHLSANRWKKSPTVYATNTRDHERVDHTFFSRRVQGRMDIQLALDS